MCVQYVSNALAPTGDTEVKMEDLMLKSVKQMFEMVRWSLRTLYSNKTQTRVQTSSIASRDCRWEQAAMECQLQNML